VQNVLLVHLIAPGNPATRPRWPLPAASIYRVPDSAPAPFERLRSGKRNWSVCDITQTTASHYAMGTIDA
jgi:hypothetical protein